MLFLPATPARPKEAGRRDAPCLSPGRQKAKNGGAQLVPGAKKAVLERGIK